MIPPQQILMCNWRDDMEDVIVELDKWVPPSSTLTILCSTPVDERKALLKKGGGLRRKLRNIAKVYHEIGHTCVRQDLEGMRPTHFDAILVFSDATKHQLMHADGKAVMCSLLIRDIQKQEALRHERHAARALAAGTSEELVHDPDAHHAICKDTVLVTEIKNSDSSRLLKLADVGDHIVADQFAALTLAQIVQDPDIAPVLIDNLLSDRGSDIAIKRYRDFLDAGAAAAGEPHGPAPPRSVTSPPDFWALMRQCRSRGDIVVGYRRKGKRRWNVNPVPKDTAVFVLPDDELLVVTRHQPLYKPTFAVSAAPTTSGDVQSCD